MANSLPSNGNRVPNCQSAGGHDTQEEISPLERLASFRFTYFSIFIFLAAYALTIEGMEGWMYRHFEQQILAATDLDPLAGPLMPRIQDGIERVLQESRWIRCGGIRVRTIALAADGRTLLYPGDRTGDSSETGPEIDAELLPIHVDLDVSVPLSSVAANVTLVAYAALLLTTLFLYTRTLTRREQLRLTEIMATRDAVANRARAIETELEAVRDRLAHIEPEREVPAEEIQSLEEERARLTEKLAEVELREERLRARSSRIQALEEERQTLEEFLEEAIRDLSQKDEEIVSLERRMKKAHRSSVARDATREAEVIARRLRTLYRNLEFDDRAVADLVRYRDEAMKLKAEEALKRLSEESENVTIRRKVGGLPPHLSIFELGFAGKGRVYYTKGRQRRYRVLTMGAKNTQKTDLEYLSRLPRE
jgi:hypothetical protein